MQSYHSPTSNHPILSCLSAELRVDLNIHPRKIPPSLQSYQFEYSKLFTKKNGSAELSDTYLLLYLEGEEKHIPFSGVASYEIQHYNGVTLYLKLTDKSKFEVQAPTAFCNAEAFERFCQELESTLTRYTREHQGTLVRKPSFFEQKWLPGFLKTGTLIIAWLLIRALSQGRGLGPALVSSGSFAGLWTAYYN